MRNSLTSTMLRGIVTASLAVLLWSGEAVAHDVSGHTRSEVATLLNLSPHQSWVHLFCKKTAAPACAVTFWCGQETGDPVTWNVTVGPSRIFSYWPGKTDTDGSNADLEAALVDAGLSPDQARSRTTCIVRSNDPLEAGAYTRIAGELVPAANENDYYYYRRQWGHHHHDGDENDHHHYRRRWGHHYHRR